MAVVRSAGEVLGSGSGVEVDRGRGFRFYLVVFGVFGVFGIWAVVVVTRKQKSTRLPTKSQA